jgi:hypothetical protein
VVRKKNAAAVDGRLDRRRAISGAGPCRDCAYAREHGFSWTINYNGFNDTFGVIPGLTAFASFTLQTVLNGNKDWTFSYTLNNTSSAPVTASRVSTFGFNTSPVDPIASTILTGTVFTKTASTNVPNGIGKIDFCTTAGPNCAGGGGGGVTIGQSTSGSFRLSFAAAVATLNLSSFYVRYQSIDDPALNIRGGSAVGVPGPIAGMGFPALFGLFGAWFYRRRRAAAA